MMPFFMKLSLALAAVVSTLVGCQLTSEPTTTLVEGTVLNKYTHQPLPAVPVTVRSWRYTLFSGVGADSVSSSLTDANGHYHIPFDANAKGTIYRVDVKDSRAVYDLTDYSKYEYRSGSDGASLTKGQTNKVDFEVTPYVPVKVFLNANKQGASLLHTFLYVDERDNQGYYNRSIFTDTARSAQHVDATITVSVVPNRTYFFILSRALVNCKDKYTCQSTYLNGMQLTRYIAYTDTSTIRLR
jgi:hypothetical protein